MTRLEFPEDLLTGFLYISVEVAITLQKWQFLDNINPVIEEIFAYAYQSASAWW